MVRPALVPLIIAGPTASGKSALALKLAKHWNGEIVCADSRQFYAKMEIGTAAPSPSERAQIPHHGYGILDPKYDKIDAGFFVNFANTAIKEIQQRHRRPILVGGTGLYLRALRYGLQDVPSSNAKIRESINERHKVLGTKALYEELKTVDEKTAETIEPRDYYRIIRALEIFYSTGKPPSDLRESFTKMTPKFNAHWIYKKPDRAELITNIEKRVKDMFAAGLVDEALALRTYLSKDHWALTVMGYQEALLYADQKINRDEAINLTVIRHRQYAKRQYTWFNKESFYRFVVSG